MASDRAVFFQPEYDSLLQGAVDNLDGFIENIKCIKETFEYSEVNLRAQHSKVSLVYKEFIDSCEVSEVDGRRLLKVPEGRIRSFIGIKKRKARAERAFELVPPSYFVSLVSAYDTFFAGLVRCFYTICPEKLLESEMEFHYRDLQQFSDLGDIKKRIVDKVIENLLRDSHVNQFEWLAKALGVGTLESFSGWSDFVELTERRNLFVHSSGTVSTQYITICSRYSSLKEDIIEGNQLTVDKEYFESSFKVLYKIAVLLTQMLLRVKYTEKAGHEAPSRVDRVLINSVFELIVAGYYDVAIDVSEIMLSNKRFVHTAFDKAYLVLNYAQACKWNGDFSKCKAILHREDWTALTNELLIPRYALEENYDEVYKRMRQLGKGNEHITISSYREWPIFKGLREEKEFEVVFSEVFGEEVGVTLEVELNQSSEKEYALTAAPSKEVAQKDGIVK